MLDMTTSALAGGKMEVYQARNQQVPAGVLVDHEGNSVTDPQAFMTGAAAMLPLGRHLWLQGLRPGHDDRRHCRWPLLGWLQCRRTHARWQRLFGIGN